MLKLVLDHDYRQPFPAVDASPFSNHGVVLDAPHVANGAQPGSGALRFSQPHSSVRVPLKHCWTRIGSLVVEAVVRLTAAPSRRNIVEGDGSFALFVAPDDTIVGSVYSLTDGNTSPTWNTVSSAANTPDGVIRKVPLNQWTRIVFQHDGITRARIFIDDQLVAVRGDYRSGVPGVASTGVVIGNWTLTSQYAFAGDIDRVRVWKLKEDAALREFRRRGDGETRDGWDEILECLRCSLNADQLVLLAQLFEIWQELLRELFRAIHQATAADRALFLSLLERYRAAWRENTLDEDESVATLRALFDLILRWLGVPWLQRAVAFAKALMRLLDDAEDCFKRGRLKKLDPALVSFLAEAARRLKKEKLDLAAE